MFVPFTPFVRHQPRMRVCTSWTRNEWPSFRNDYPNLLRWPKYLCTKTCSFCVHIINVWCIRSTMTYPSKRVVRNFKRNTIKIVYMLYLLIYRKKCFVYLYRMGLFKTWSLLMGVLNDVWNSILILTCLSPGSKNVNIYKYNITSCITDLSLTCGIT
jgi:hypothetical protein